MSTRESLNRSRAAERGGKRRKNASPEGLLVAVYSLCVVAVATMVLFVSPTVNGAGITLSIILLGIVVASYLWPFGRGRYRDASDPVFLGGIIVLLGFGMRTVLLVRGTISDGLDVATRSAFGTQFGVHYLYGLAFGLVCWATLVAGYHIRFRNYGCRSSISLPTTNQYVLFGLIWGLNIVGWLCRIYVLLVLPARFDTSTTGDYSPVATLVSQLEFLATASLAVALVYFSKFRERWLLASVVLIVFLECAYAVPAGSRTQLFSAVIMVLSWFGMRGPVRLGWLSLPAIVGGLFTIGFTFLYRLGSADGIISRFANTVRLAVDLGPLGVMDQAIFNISYRFHGLDSVTSILFVDVGNTYGWGSTYLFKAIAPLVPRFLWPGKPQETAGQELARTYFQVSEESSVYYAPTWMGDLSQQFPPLLVILAFFILGLVLGRIRRLALPDALADTPSIGQLIYLLVIPPFVITDGWLHVALYDTIKALAAGAAIVVVLRLFSHRAVGPKSRRDSLRPMHTRQLRVWPGVNGGRERNKPYGFRSR